MRFALLLDRLPAFILVVRIFVAVSRIVRFHVPGTHWLLPAVHEPAHQKRHCDGPENKANRNRDPGCHRAQTELAQNDRFFVG